MSGPSDPTAPRPLGDRVGHWFAVWFGCGHVPRAPGTAGTIGAIPLFYLLRAGGPLALLAAAALLLVIGVWAAGVVVREKGTHDPQIVCIDEVVGVLVTWSAAPLYGRSGLYGMIAGFVLFRVFDQCKPFPARRAESLPRGWGVMMDDVFAGIWGAAVMLVVRRWM